MTKLLLDTHVLLWWADSPEKLTESSRLNIASGRNSLYFSHASIWELNIKISQGSIAIPGTIESLMQRSRCQPLSITIPHLEAIKNLPFIHKDPFDRLLIAQAIVDKLTLVTRDQNIHQYDVEKIAA